MKQHSMVTHRSMTTIKHLLLAALLIALCAGCTEKVSMGSPVGTWTLWQTSVTFNADGSLIRQSEGLLPDPDFLAPLENGKPGTWKTDNHNLFLFTTRPDGTTETRRYEYSVGTGGKGEPALEIEIPEGPHKSSYVLTKQ